MSTYGGAGTVLFRHFDQYDFVATTTDGGTITNVGTKKVNWHTGITYKMTPKTGYHMKKLTVDEKVVPNASTYSFTMATAGHTIDVEWEANSYNIVYDKNGGTGSMPNQNMEYDTEAALSPNLFTKTGYTFSGWRLGNKDTGTKYSDRQKVTNLTAIDGDVVTMYAQWIPNGYTIKYNSNGGTGTMPNQTMTYDVSAKLDANRFTRRGYTWIGWKRDNATSGTTYRNRQEVMNLLSANGGTTTMYAQWSPNSYTVTFIDGFSKKTIETQGINYGQPAKEPARPNHTGYTATGLDSDFSNITGDMTVTVPRLSYKS